MKEKFEKDDLLFAVATWNADPFCIENDEQIDEVWEAITDNGITEVRDEERKTALAQLDLPQDSPRIIYRAGDCLLSFDDDEYTFDIEFNDDEKSDSKGFHSSLQYCKDYIEMNNGTNESYFEDYKGGTVAIRCNETEEVVFETEVL